MLIGAIHLFSSTLNASISFSRSKVFLEIAYIREYMTLVARKANPPPLSSFISLVRGVQGITGTGERECDRCRACDLPHLPAQSATRQGARPRLRDIERACISRAAGSRIERRVDAWIKYRPVNDRQVDYEISLKSRTVRRISVNRYLWRINCWRNIIIASAVYPFPFLQRIRLW